ncbi:MAG: molybdopterin-dependent oxidoreductase [Actinobacteria bacterium]|nr:molybdopterin-dependent oxidoreductase [Actinomycetota bacterium]
MELVRARGAHPRMTLRVIALTAVLSATSCAGGTSDPVADVRPLTEGTLSAADVTDASEGAELQLTGDLGLANDGDALLLSTTELEQLATVELDVYEPFEERRIRFSGVRVADLLDFADVPERATALHLVAHDDYSVTLDVAALRDEGAVLATRAEGEPIALEAGGPIRLVFPDGAVTGANPDLWIWSVRDIDVR